MAKAGFEDLETGYEPRFDFPYRAEAPKQFYLFASVPRTGSTFVSHLLWGTGCLGAPLEYLNFLASGPYHFAQSDPLAQLELWNSALHRRTSPNGVFGIKCFSLQLRELQRSNPKLVMDVLGTLLSKGAAAHVVQLKRRDRVAHAISYARAALSGVWHKSQEGAGGLGVDYSGQAVDHARLLLDQQEADWQRLFEEIGVQPLVLWYEEVIERPEDMVSKVASFLEVKLDPEASIRVPAIEKQSEVDAKLWAELYADGSS